MSSDQGPPSSSQYGPAYTGAEQPVSRRQGNTLSIVGIVLGIVAIVIAPIIVGVIGIIFAGIAKGKKEPLSTWALIVSIGGTVIGMILGAIVYNNTVA
jgi:hypothetical protein